MNSVPQRATIAICALVWFGLLVLDGTVEPSRKLWGPYTLVVMVAGGLTWLFEKHLWSLWPFTLVVRHPDLRGTWQGEIRSEWVNPQTNAALPPIPVFMCITQSASELHLRQFTKESESMTMAASIVRERDDAHTITVVYQNDPKSDVRDRSEIHLGGMRLRVTGADTLEGHYWTDRKTRGQLTLRRVSADKCRSFAESAGIADSTSNASG